MAKSKVTRKAAAKQAAKKIRQEIRILYDKREKEREKERQEIEKIKQLSQARSVVAHRYWDDKKATVNDVLEEISYDMQKVRTIVEGLHWSIYATHLVDSLLEEQQRKIMWGIHETLELVADFMGDRLERAEGCYTDGLPTRKQGGRS